MIIGKGKRYGNEDMRQRLTFTSSGSPHSSFLKVTRTWLFVGLNSKPSSSQGVSSFAVPGMALAEVEANLRCPMDSSFLADWLPQNAGGEDWKEETEWIKEMPSVNILTRMIMVSVCYLIRGTMPVCISLVFSFVPSET